MRISRNLSSPFFLCAVLVALSVFPVQGQTSADPLQITGVRTDRTLIHTDKKEQVTVHFHINQNAKVVLSIYDARDYLIRQVKPGGVLSEGDHAMTWDGLDQAAKPVPPEAYFYTLTAFDEAGTKVEHDLTDKTGGETVVISDLKYNKEKNVVTYVLPQPVRLYIRISIKEGSLMRTVVNNAVREAGPHSEPWDGKDESKVVVLRDHPNLILYGEGYRLSRNAILVRDAKPLPMQASWTTGLLPDNGKREKGPRSKHLNIHAYHKVESCRDIQLTVSLPGNVRRDADGLPVISGPTAIHVNVSESDTLLLEAQRFEIVYFLDNRLMYENEVSYIPYTWIWDPKVLTGGVHYLTALVVSYDGHYGVATIKVSIDTDKKQKRAKDA